MAHEPCDGCDNDVCCYLKDCPNKDEYTWDFYPRDGGWYDEN